MARSGTSSASEPPQPTAIRILDTTYARRRRLLPGELRDIPSPETVESVGNISTHIRRRYTYPRRETLVPWMTWGSGRKYTRSMRHWTKKGDALEELHGAHSISTVSYNRVNLDPIERGRQETIQRREREIVRQEDSSTGSCEEEIREINAAEFQANVEQRRRVRRRLPETPPSNHSLLRGIPAFTTRKGG